VDPRGRQCVRDAALDRTARIKKNFAVAFFSLFLKQPYYFVDAGT
jgi:hypothetical protein